MQELVLDFELGIEEKNEILKGLYWIDPQLGSFQFDHKNNSLPILKYKYQGEKSDDDIQSQILLVVDNIIKSRTSSNSSDSIFETDFGNTIHGKTYDNLVENGMLHRASTGVYTWKGFAVTLFKAVDSWVLTKAQGLGCEEWITPNIVSSNTLNKTGYLHNFPQHVFLLSHLPEDSCLIRQARKRWSNLDKNGGVDDELLMSGATQALSPTVCCHVFQSMEGISTPGEAPLLVTSMNSCYRHEGRSTHGLERLSEFHMRELVAIGQKDQITLTRDKYLGMLELMMKSFCLDGKICHASDPFFFDNVAHKRLFQKSFELKQEMQLKVDSKCQFCAAGSVNYHQDYFGNSFKISSKSQPSWSTCIGFGIDRICYSIFSQHGTDPGKWGATVLNNLKISL